MKVLVLCGFKCVREIKIPPMGPQILTGDQIHSTVGVKAILCGNNLDHVNWIQKE